MKKQELAIVAMQEFLEYIAPDSARSALAASFKEAWNCGDDTVTIHLCATILDGLQYGNWPWVK